MARQGCDAVCIDMQHGLSSESDIVSLLQALAQTATAALVRVPGHDPAVIMRVLDLGAEGVIVPLVNTPQQAAQLVAACRYPPLGQRSFGPLRSRLVYGDSYSERANDEVVVLAMIETAEGLANLEAICATPGLTGIFIGPADLSYALGLAPETDSSHPDHVAAVARIVASCRRQGRVVGIYSDDPDFARAAVGQGMQLVVVANDVRALQTGIAARLAAFRSG